MNKHFFTLCINVNIVNVLDTARRSSSLKRAVKVLYNEVPLDIRNMLLTCDSDAIEAFVQLVQMAKPDARPNTVNRYRQFETEKERALYLILSHQYAV